MMKHLQGMLLIFLVEVAVADWHPPENPDPRAILKEAREDAISGKFEHALAKHLWFHNNALKYRRSLYGVRLSFALSDWKRLSNVYPPALDKMREVRDKAEEYVQNGVQAYNYFHDFESLNEQLGDEGDTVRLFVWLDNNKPETAFSVYRLAQPSLIKENKFALAGKYVDHQSTFGRIVGDFAAHKEYINKYSSEWGALRLDETRRFGQMRFTNSSAILVALLVLTERVDDAKDISEQALLEFDSPEFRDTIDKALRGVVPRAWP